METDQVGLSAVETWSAHCADQTPGARRTAQSATLTRRFIRTLQAAFVGIILAQFSFDPISPAPHIAPALAGWVPTPEQLFVLNDDYCLTFSLSQSWKVAGVSQIVPLSAADLKARFSKQILVAAPLLPAMRERSIELANSHKDIIDRIRAPGCYVGTKFYDLSEQLEPNNFGVIVSHRLTVFWIDPTHPFAFVDHYRNYNRPLECGSFTDFTGEVFPACLLDHPIQGSVLIFQKGNELRFYDTPHAVAF